MRNEEQKNLGVTFIIGVMIIIASTTWVFTNIEPAENFLIDSWYPTERILLDSNWKKVTNSHKATYLRKINWKDEQKSVALRVRDYYYPSMVLQWTGKVLALYPRFIKEGKCLRYYPNGKLQAVEHFKDSLRNGEHLLLSQQGDTLISGHYIDGYKSGLWEFYNDSVIVLKNYYRNILHGGYAVLSVPEMPTERVDTLEYGIFSNGKRQGRWHFPNGQFLTYKNGRLHGPALNKDDNGNVLLSGSYDTEESFTGIRYRYSSNSLIEKTQVEKGFAHGIAIAYGSVYDTVLIMHRGKRHGRFIVVDGSYDTPLTQEVYEHQVLAEGYYQNNKLHGLFVTKTGSDLERQQYYYNGKLIIQDFDLLGLTQMPVKEVIRIAEKINIAERLYEQQNLRDAESLLWELYKINKLPYVSLMLTQINLETHNYSQALPLLEYLYRNHYPQSRLEFSIQLTDLYLNIGHLTTAERQIAASLEHISRKQKQRLYPSGQEFQQLAEASYQVKLQQVSLFKSVGNYQRAAQTIQAIRKDRCCESGLAVYVGGLLIKNASETKEYLLGIELMDQVIHDEKQGRLAEAALISRAIAYANLEHYQNALSDVKQIIAMNPGNQQARQMHDALTQMIAVRHHNTVQQSSLGWADVLTIASIAVDLIILKGRGGTMRRLLKKAK